MKAWVAWLAVLGGYVKALGFKGRIWREHVALVFREDDLVWVVDSVEGQNGGVVAVAVVRGNSLASRDFELVGSA